MTGSEQPAVIAVDQGTSATKALAVAADGAVLDQAVVKVSQHHPMPGWVEQDATELLDSVLSVLTQLLQRVPGPIASVGLSTQRESAIVWNRHTGEPLGPVLGWQDRRTSARASELKAGAQSSWVRAITGLPIDPMFSALKFQWLLDAIDPDRSRARSGELALGTIDSFLLHRLTGRHCIEAGNASRTQLLDLERVTWDEQLLELFEIPQAALPEVIDSDTHLPLLSSVVGRRHLSIDAVFGDSHAALYGHGVRSAGEVKVTYGTGSSIMGLLPGTQIAECGLARTIAWRLGERTAHAFEGNILATGATLVWLAEILELTPGELIELARESDPLHGVNLVPAFAGLAAPWWAEQAQATLTGLTLATSRTILARAAVDSVVLQIEDVVAAAEGSGIPIAGLLVDGGPTSNDWLMQLQADLSMRPLRRSRIPELSALGAAQLAAERAGLPLTRSNPPAPRDDFRPQLDQTLARARRQSWAEAVALAINSAPRPAQAHIPVQVRQGADA